MRSGRILVLTILQLSFVTAFREKCRNEARVSGKEHLFLPCVLETQFGELQVGDIIWIRTRLLKNYSRDYDIVQMGFYEDARGGRNMLDNNLVGTRKGLYWAQRLSIPGVEYIPILRFAFDGKKLICSWIKAFKIDNKERKRYYPEISEHVKSTFSMFKRGIFDMKIRRTAPNKFHVVVNFNQHFDVDIDFMGLGKKQTRINAIELRRTSVGHFEGHPAADFIAVFATEYPSPFVSMYPSGGFPFDGHFEFVAEAGKHNVFFILNNDFDDYYKLSIGSDGLELRRDASIIHSEKLRYEIGYYMDITIERHGFGMFQRLCVGLDSAGLGHRRFDKKSYPLLAESVFEIRGFMWESPITHLKIESALPVLYVFDPI